MRRLRDEHQSLIKGGTDDINFSSKIQNPSTSLSSRFRRVSFKLKRTPRTRRIRHHHPSFLGAGGGTCHPENLKNWRHHRKPEPSPPVIFSDTPSASFNPSRRSKNQRPGFNETYEPMNRRLWTRSTTPWTYSKRFPLGK
jgi:hypothetical protein